VTVPGSEEAFLAVSRLRFKKGDLIMKQGDYGISIYMVVSGRVEVYTESAGTETSLATLGPGNLIGEMVFLSREPRRRSASARALDDCELELLHPETLAREYEQMPAIVKMIADQCTRRLFRMDRLVAELSLARGKREEKNWGERGNLRAHYRKKVRMLSTCRPSEGSSRQASMGGEIRDISLGGVGIEVPRFFSEPPYRAGVEFWVETRLPNSRPLSFKAKLVRYAPGWTPRSDLLGMSFTSMSEAARRDLGFFMMGGN
jgi:CRP-like cAMP-binding protein